MASWDLFRSSGGRFTGLIRIRQERRMANRQAGRRPSSRALAQARRREQVCEGAHSFSQLIACLQVPAVPQSASR
eukprot:6185257-Pleurochrysis_carterae.AAC.2